jgi:hypothetical protein
MLSFSYRQVSLTTMGQNADGSSATPVTFSYDLATNREGVTIPHPTVPADADQHLPVGHDADVLIGGSGHILAGDHVGQDQFIFRDDIGSNEITNFSRPDQMLIEKPTFGTAGDSLEHYASDDGHGNTKITDLHHPADMITLDHVSVDQLDVSHFVLQ